MKRVILLAGPSAAGKSTLGKALCHGNSGFVFSTSAFLRSQTGIQDPAALYIAGAKLDAEHPRWLRASSVDQLGNNVVIDSVRSHAQHNCFSEAEAVRVNVVADEADIPARHAARGTTHQPTYFMFNRPDFVWNSSRMSITQAVQAIRQLAGAGYCDLLVGGQFGSEGKGKLAAILAPSYEALVRTGGPNAGHWVREKDKFEYCYHHLPSGTMSNQDAQVIIAAGATINPKRFWEEVEQTGCMRRLFLDQNVVLIEDQDREDEAKTLIGNIGSTAQGVGYAQARRIRRESSVRTAYDEYRANTCRASEKLSRLLTQGNRVMVEGTQGSMLSLYHGEYPFTTSRDTNAGGLLAEVGIAPCYVRDTWMVIRSYPIRVAGNSGPMQDEVGWDFIANRTGRDETELRRQEMTSTTNRQRRVAKFSFGQLAEAVNINRPSKLFLSFADYLHPGASDVTQWGKLPDAVHKFINDVEHIARVPVVGVSTGRYQHQAAFRWPLPSE